MFRGNSPVRAPFVGLVLWILIMLLTSDCLAQNSLMLEKVGRGRKFFFHTEDKFMLRTVRPDTFLSGHIWDIAQKNMVLQTYIPITVQYDNIRYVYRDHKHLKKIGVYFCIFSGVTFGVISINHLLNNEQVFTPDMAYLTLPFLGVGILSISCSRERFKLGYKWKLKVMDMPVFPIDGR